MIRIIIFLVLIVSQSYAGVDADVLMGKVEFSKSSAFVDVATLGIPTEKEHEYLLKEVADHLLAAYHDFHEKYPHIPFVVISAGRNFDHQKQIWDRKWHAYYPHLKNSEQTARKILEYSSMPGTSRHHWGTDFDLTSLDNNYFESKSGRLLFEWMKQNMPRYGFYRPYIGGRNKGYHEEKWHWSYKKIAKSYLAQYYSLIQVEGDNLKYKLHFEGSDSLPLLNYIKEYVFSINADLL